MDVESTAKEELSKLGTQALKDLYENLSGAKQFILAQAPDICQQMIAWQIAQGVLSLVMAAIVIGGTLALFRYFYNRDITDGVIGVSIFGGMASLIVAVVACIETCWALQAIVAPKLFLLERIASMLK